MVELEFHGAAETVTGSMHILHLPDGPVALDCGLFQGKRSWSREMNLTCPVDPSKLRAVLLSHAHIDHSGKIPFLVREKFHGKVYATSATRDLCEVMLADSAHIQEEDARYWNEKRASCEAEQIEPLYTAEDAIATKRIFKGVRYNQPVKFAPGCTATFLEAGHILGSACILVEINQSTPIRLLYTGDLGRFDMPILRDPTCPLPKVDYLITESTYSNRCHADAGSMKERLAKIINETRAAGGKVIIPAFSVGRTQHLVYNLTVAIEEGLIEPLPIYVDSPLSVNVTKVFREHPECYDVQARDFWAEQGGVFGRGLITYITDVRDSIALNSKPEPCVIISASGMCEVGRILHHLKNNIQQKKNTVVICGYQARHTLGRRIVDRNEQIKIFGMMYHLNARVETLNGFSAHADASDFAKLLGPIAADLKCAFVVHGENDRLEIMKDLLKEQGCRYVEAPAQGDKFRL